jgi:hypothetical protein
VESNIKKVKFLFFCETTYDGKVYPWLAALSACSFGFQAGEVTLAWDPPSTEYGGFILAYGTSSGSYSHTKDVGSQATYTVTSLNPGQTYYFAVKA